MKNFTSKEVIPSPLCNPTTIFQIYTSSNLTTLLVEDDPYYFYDSLRKDTPIPEVVPKIHTALQFWYEDNYEAKPSILENPDPNIITKSCPLQRDKWICY